MMDGVKSMPKGKPATRQTVRMAQGTCWTFPPWQALASTCIPTIGVAMKDPSLERRLLGLYKLAVRQKNWVVADHLLSAIEACAPLDDVMSDTVAEAYSALVDSTAVFALAPAPGSKSGT